MIIIFLGPPGAGKGTQAVLLAEKYGLKHIATGDIFRWHMQNNTDLGKKIKKYLDRGELVPDDITIKIVEQEIQKYKNTKGILLDGFPRTLTQAKMLDEILKNMNLKINLVLYLRVSKEEAARRLLARGRHDDKLETIARRFEEYEEKTRPIREYYYERGILVEVNGEQTIENVHKDIVDILKEKKLI